MRRTGLVTFGSVMLMLVGVFNIIDGIVAIAKPEYFSDDLLFSDLTAWGWFFFVFGIVQLGTGYAVWTGNEIALWAGIVLAGANAAAQLAYLAHRPVWSIVIIACDMLVIYGFTARGMELGTEEVPED